jgi:hypothetical protein
VSGENKFYVNLLNHNNQILGGKRNRKHHDILEVEDLQLLIKNIISDVPDVIPTSSVVTTTKPTVVKPERKLTVSVHSPVDIGITDTYGNYTGIIESGDGFTKIKEEIPNSSYYELDDGKYVSVGSDEVYQVKLKGTGAGSFRVEVVEREGEEIIESKSFIDLPVTPLLEASIDFNAGQEPVLKIDVNGDGVVDVQRRRMRQDQVHLRRCKRRVPAVRAQPRLGHQRPRRRWQFWRLVQRRWTQIDLPESVKQMANFEGALT